MSARDDELKAMIAEATSMRHEAIERETEAYVSLQRNQAIVDRADAVIDKALAEIGEVLRINDGIQELPGLIRADDGQWVLDQDDPMNREETDR